MDRNLEIALVSGALAALWGYVLQLRLKQGHAGPAWFMVTRQANPAQFWTLMLVLSLVEAGFIGLSLMNFAAWLDS